MTTQEIIEVIKGLSVLELNDLVKACEEEFGVSAAAKGQYFRNVTITSTMGPGVKIDTTKFA